jgi:ribose-phosphate pyrophosphokinase
MLIDLDVPERSQIAYQKFVFPDGQAHFQVEPDAIITAAALGPIDLVGAIKSGNDLLNMGLAIDAIASVKSAVPIKINLNISYLLGARMDRRIGPGQPTTLSVIAGVLNHWAGSLNALRILDPHSSVSQTLMPNAQMLFPDMLVDMALKQLQHQYGRAPVVVIPDAGAVPRTQAILQRLGCLHDVARCSKIRDPHTGRLSGFEMQQGNVASQVALIVDDICDGGGTFAGIAKVLRARGATKVYLCVTHAVLSKGAIIDSIDGMFATDSYGQFKSETLVMAPSADGRLTQFKSGETVVLTTFNGFMAQAIAQ